ncbi:MAG: hypothetical protein ACOYBE_10075 [Blautia sp.]|jgi:hypothetical protein
MGEQEFAYQIFQVLNHTRRLDIVTLTIEPDQMPPTLHVELCSGERFCLTIQETEETF